MSVFKRSATGLFASESLIGHLLRGGVAIGLLGWAIQVVQKKSKAQSDAADERHR